MINDTDSHVSEGQEAEQNMNETFMGKPVKWYKTAAFSPPIDAEDRLLSTQNDKG